MSLQKLQDDFILHLLRKSNDFDVDELNARDGITAEQRLDVHRQTIIENLVNSIEIIYPEIWQLLGRDCARGVALSYIHEMKYLPQNGTMADYGNKFPEYLATFPSTKHLPYIKDFAIYEWLKSECYHAKFYTGISFEDLQSLSEESLTDVKFIFNDTVQFFTSNYAVDDIQRMLDNPDSEFISLSEDKYFFIIHQNQGRVVTSRVVTELWDLLQELYAHKTFGAVADKYADRSGFDFSYSLRFIVENNLVRQIQQ